MPLYRLLQNSGFEPSHIEAMTYAFESICKAQQLAITNPGRERVARVVIEVAQRGERDPIKLKQAVQVDLAITE
jgi:hypothetical protein